MDDFFFCPHCNMYTIDTWTPDDLEDRCPICGHIRPDDAPNLEMEFPLDSYTHGKDKVYRVHDGKREMEFVDVRTPYFVRVEPENGDDPRYLVMDPEGMVFALGDTPDPCENRVVKRTVSDPNMSFNGNGPVKISYTTNPGFIGSLNLKPAGKGSAKGLCPKCGKKVRGNEIGGRVCCPKCGCDLQDVKRRGRG